MEWHFDINTPKDLRKIRKSDLPIVADDIRNFLGKFPNLKEGHLVAGLGVVELTIALHYVFDTPNDRLIWDVGHQCYPHKIITGRKDNFASLRKEKGIAGFPTRKESPYDAFGTGHSSTSISALLGMAIAAQLKGLFKRQHIAVIGDAAIAGGMALEALNHACETKANMMIILNDNDRGIDPTIGALKQHFNGLKKDVIKNPTLATLFNFDYTGVVNGHDLNELIQVFKETKSKKGLQLIHVATEKGRGHRKIQNNDAPSTITYQEIIGATLVKLATKNEQITAITPAMPTGSGLSKMMQTFPERTFDVGIAEQHAVTLAAGMATQGFRPFCFVYSSFLQRAYDQIIHDVCLQSLPVVFCIDRAGLVGEDGATHHGVFDLAFLRSIPNLIITSVMDGNTLRFLLAQAQGEDVKLPIVIRYPRGAAFEHSDPKINRQNTPWGKSRVLQKGTALCLISIGHIGVEVKKAIENLPIAMRQQITHLDLIFIKPLDETTLHQIFEEHRYIIVVEEHSVIGGGANAIIEFAHHYGYKNNISLKGISDDFVAHGSVEGLRTSLGLDSQSIKKVIKKVLTRSK